jgi:hypothetical protein
MAVVAAIATTYLEADAASVTFSGIDGTYENLQIRCHAKSQRAGSDVDSLQVAFNGVETDTYSYQWMRGHDSAVASGGLQDTRLRLQHLTAAQGGVTDAANFGSIIFNIFDHTNPYKNTCTTTIMGINGAYDAMSFETGLWDNVAAITSIKLSCRNGPNFLRGSEFTLYGWND